MIVGILSDTHDRVGIAAEAIQLLRQRGAELLIHCGDVGESVLGHLAGGPAVFVWGNTDLDRATLQRDAEHQGIICGGDSYDLVLGGKRAAVTHGDDPHLMQQIVEAQQCDYLFHGHTHVRRDQRVGRVRIINPGALHRTAQKSVALLDPDADRLEFIAINS